MPLSIQKADYFSAAKRSTGKEPVHLCIELWVYAVCDYLSCTRGTEIQQISVPLVQPKGAALWTPVQGGQAPLDPKIGRAHV